MRCLQPGACWETPRRRLRLLLLLLQGVLQEVLLLQGHPQP